MLSVSSSSVITPILYSLLSSFVLVGLLLAGTYIFTNVRYRYALKHSENPDPTKPHAPPKIPYTIPLLGSALTFLSCPKPGLFWNSLFKWHPRGTGACTLLLGGQATHILFNPNAVQGLFKAKSVNTDNFKHDIVTKGFGMEVSESRKFYGIGDSEKDEKTGLTAAEQQEKIMHDYLLKGSSVNELTAEFTKILRAQLRNELSGELEEHEETDLYSWVRARIFAASTTALMGKTILEIYPDLEPDFFKFDQTFLSCYFGIPKFIIPDVYENRDRTMRKLVKWHEAMQEELKGKVPDPAGLAWEPRYGSRVNRARQVYYQERGLNVWSRAVLDLGFIFGLSSNAIPCIGWMLMHILNPQGDETLLPRILEELKTARKGDGSLDVPTLVNLPLFVSSFHEVLRLYTDVLVTRELSQDLTLPLGEDRGSILLKKNGAVIAPCWLGHHDESRWQEPPCEMFYAERFLKTDPKTGKPVFRTNGTTGKFFPFGGGKSMCPGRVFARQEVMAAVAMILLGFDFEPLLFIDEKGKETQSFPCTERCIRW